jgi:hypothetical protein
VVSIVGTADLDDDAAAMPGVAAEPPDP